MEAVEGQSWEQWLCVKPSVCVNYTTWEKKEATVEKRSVEKGAVSKGEVIEW